MLNFPNTPADGETSFQPNGVTYQWVAADSRWIVAGSVAGSNVVAGTVVQVVTIERSDSFNLTGVIPTNNSKPQITEGTEFFSKSFVPKFADSKIHIEVVANTVSAVLATTNTIALFQDAIALATAAISQPAAGYITQQVLRASFPAGSTAARTYSMRGAVNAGGGSLWLNSGGPSYALWDGTLISSMTITETQPNAVVPDPASGVEGVYTMGLWDAASAGNQAPTTVQVPWYRVGDMVTVFVPRFESINLSGLTGGGTLYFDLPFPPRAGAEAVGPVVTRDINWTARTQANFWLLASADRFFIVASADSLSQANVQVNSLSGASIIYGGQLTYLKA